MGAEIESPTSKMEHAAESWRQQRHGQIQHEKKYGIARKKYNVEASEYYIAPYTTASESYREGFDNIDWSK